jgi:hypothetical protein
MFRNFKLVPRVIFGRGCFAQMDEILSPRRTTPEDWVAFMVDDVFSGAPWRPASHCMTPIFWCMSMWMMNPRPGMWTSSPNR